MTASTPQPPIDTQALEKLLDAATPGPWAHYGDHLVWPSERGPAANDPILATGDAHDDSETGDFPNAALIVAAVNALPGLLAHLAAVTTERDTLLAERSGNTDTTHRMRLYVALTEQRVIDSQKYGEAPYAPITWEDVTAILDAAPAPTDNQHNNELADRETAQ